MLLEYTMIKNISEGKQGEWIALPVAKNPGKELPDETRPYTAFEVLTNFYGEDMSLVLGNYINMELETIQSSGAMQNAASARLLSYCYKMTRSRIRQSTDQTVVDFIVRGDMEGVHKDTGEIFFDSMDFRIRYLLDMRPCSQAVIGPLINPDQGDDEILMRHSIVANDYLLPIMYAKDYEIVAREMFEHYYPEMKNQIGEFVLDPMDLAQRMGLTVYEVRFPDDVTMGQLYYSSDVITLLDAAGKPHRVKVNPATMLISKDKCTSEGIRNSTIVHECCHMYLDRWFFLLQMMSGRKTACYTNKRKRQKKSYKKNTPIDWMELQCDKLPAYLLLEKGSIRSFVDKKLRQLEGPVTPAKMHTIIASVSAKFHVSFAMAKYRMIELGYYEAGGISCFQDSTMIPDHGCSGAWPENTTYTISADSVLELMDRDDHLATTLKSGRYRYVEGHFCLNHSKYLVYDRGGRIHLSEYARTHMNECCIAFTVNGRYTKSNYHMGQVSRTKTTPVTDKYLPEYELTAEPGTDKYEQENALFADDVLLWGDFLYDMSDDYKEAVMDIMKRKGVTQESLALEMGVDRKMIYKCLNAINPSKPHLVAICVALKLPFFISEKVLMNAGITFRRTDADHLYRSFLLRAEQLTVERCDDILKLHHMPTLFERAA